MGRPPPTIHLFGFSAPSPSVYTLPEPLRQAFPFVLHLSFGPLSHTDLFLICLPFPSGEPSPALGQPPLLALFYPRGQALVKNPSGSAAPPPPHTSRGPKPRMAPGIGSSFSAFPRRVVYELSHVARATPAVGGRAGGIVPAPTRALVAVTRQTDVTSHPAFFSPTLPTQRQPAWDNS